MSNVVTQEQGEPTRGQLRLDNTAADNVTDFHLPEVAPLSTENRYALLEQKFGSAYASRFNSDLSLVATLHGKFQANTQFLCRQNFTQYAKVIADSNQAMEAALAAGDSAQYAAQLDRLKKFLGSISNFIDYEKQQGLVGTCVDCGVRIYLRGDSVWLCTPDKGAFQDLAKDQRDKLREFVKGITGVEIDFDSAHFQTEGRDGAVKLLGCRLDNLKLKTVAEGEKYSVQTHVRQGADFQQRIVQFTWADLKAGKVEGLFDQNSALPQLTVGGRPVTGTGTDAVVAPAAEVKQDVSAAARVVAPVARVRFPLGTGSTTSDPATPNPRNTPTPVDQTEFTTRITERSTLRNRLLTDIDSLDTPDKVSQALKDLDASQQQFDDALKSRREFLDKQLKEHPWNSREYREAAQHLDDLRQVEAQDVLARKQMLEKGIALADDAAKPALQKQLVGMQRSVADAFETRIQGSTDPAVRAALEAERDAFNKFIADAKPSRGYFGRALDRVRQLATVKIETPSWARIRPRVVAWMESRAFAQAEATIKRLGETNVASMNPTEQSSQLRQLERQSKQWKELIKEYDAKLRAGDTSVQGRLDTLREADAKASVRRGEILERQLAEATDPKVQQQLKAKLVAEAADIEQGHRHLGNNTAADEFVRRQQGITPEIEREQLLATHANDKFLAREIATRKKVEAALAKATPGSAQHTELLAAKEVAVAGENMRLAEIELRELEAKLNPEVVDDALNRQIESARTKLTSSQDLHAQQRVRLCETRLKTVTDRLTQIDTELGAAANDVERAKLTREKAALELKRADLEIETAQTQAEGASGQIKRDVAALRDQLEQQQQAAAAETDPVRKADLESQITSTKREILRKELQHMDAELRGVEQGQKQLRQMLADNQGQIDAAKTANNANELKTQEANRAKLQKKLDALVRAQEYLEGQKTIIQLESRVDRLKSLRSRTMQDITSLDRPNLTTVEQARLDQLKSRLGGFDKALAASESELVTTSRAINGRWAQEIQRAKAVFNAQVMPKFGEWAAKNPVKAATIVGSIAEGFRRMSEASYKEDARHTYLPSLLCLLDSDLEDGFMGILPAQFTTKQLGGELGARPMEFVSGAGNVVLIMQGFRMSQYVLGNTVGRTAAGRSIGTALGTKLAGRTLGFVGAGLDGYLTFSDLNTWQHDNGEQLTAKVASPVLIGAGFGAFFGPPGAVIGALGGAVGEMAGVTHAYFKLQSEIDRDWRKKGVRESIDAAERGYVYTENHSVLRSRSRDLNEFEKETIDDLTKQRLLSRMFGDESLFSRGELEAMGFKLSGEGAGAHNYERLSALIEPATYRWLGRESWHVWESDSYKLQQSHGDLWNKLHTARSEDENYYRDMYFRAPRIAYENRSNGQAPLKHSEMGQFFDDVAAHYRAEMGKLDADISARGLNRAAITKEIAEVQWQVLIDKFPHLGHVLRSDFARQEFFNRFKTATGVDLRKEPFWTHKSLAPTGQAFVSQYMPEAFNELPTVGLQAPLTEVDRLYQELLGNSTAEEVR